MDAGYKSYKLSLRNRGGKLTVGDVDGDIATYVYDDEDDDFEYYLYEDEDTKEVAADKNAIEIAQKLKNTPAT